MSALIKPYLTFDGNCREAMTFYKDCLGGELLLQSVEDSPMAKHSPAQVQKNIMHSMLTSGSLVLMGSDMSPVKLVKGNSISLVVECSSEEELRTWFGKLSDGGQVTHDIHVSFWGALFGTLTGRFGHQWMLTFPNNAVNG